MTPSFPELLDAVPPVLVRSPLEPENADIRVGLLLPLSGTSAALGQALLHAAEMALFDAAAAEFALIVRDTRGTPEGAAQAANEAIGAGAQLIIGPLFSASVRAVTPAAQAAGINVLAFSTDSSVAGDGIFVIGPLPRTQVERIVGYASRQGLRRFAALVPNSAYGQAIVVAMNEATERFGVSMAQIEYYDPNAADVSESVRRLASYEARAAALAAERAALAGRQDQASIEALERLNRYDTLGEIGFDAVLLPEGGARLRSVAPLLPFYDIDPAEVRLLGTALWQDPDLGVEPALVGGWFAAPQPELWEAFERRYRAIYEATPPRVASLAYDATALAAVLARSGGAEGFTMDALMQPSGFIGTDGVFRFREDGTVERALAVLELQREGIIVVDPAPQSFEEKLF